jgi:FkbM family methyltransferase
MAIKLPGFLRPETPPMFSHGLALERLKNLGFAPSTIYDIGAFHGDWTKEARHIFPSAKYVMFEANADNKPALEATGEKFVMAVLSDTDGVAKNLYLPKQTIATGVSLYREKTVHYSDDLVKIVPVTTRRLDVLAKEHKLPSPDFIKLDVQGAELDVLAGAGDLLRNCVGLMAEMSVLAYNDAAPLFADVIAGIDRLGFRSVDISEIHRTQNGSIFQMDMLFVNPTFYEKYRAAAGLT